MPDWAKRATIGTAILLTFWTLSYAGAPEQVSIQKIVAEGSSMQRRQVTLQGVVHDLQAMPSPSRRGYGNCLFTYGQAAFSLDDGTGNLPVEVIGSCGSPPSPLPKNGDEVRLTAIIQVLNTDLPLRLLAQTTSHITILDPK
jgi:DNA/RNA endonuclease YhcR with UshA esterase domain